MLVREFQKTETCSCAVLGNFLLVGNKKEIVRIMPNNFMTWDSIINMVMKVQFIINVRRRIIQYKCMQNAGITKYIVNNILLVPEKEIIFVLLTLSFILLAVHQSHTNLTSDAKRRQSSAEVIRRKKYIYLWML